MYKNIKTIAMATALITQGVYAEDIKWNSSFDLGATITIGNSDTTLVTLGFQRSKLGKRDEYFANLFILLKRRKMKLRMTSYWRQHPGTVSL